MQTHRRNRVDPWGELHAVAARGTLMGNRGRLHNAAGQVVFKPTTRRWIACSLEFGGVRRTIFSPTSYTELFFLDETTAFSAGHRPCAECRRDRYNAFRDAWASATRLPTRPAADEIDLVLNDERRSRSNGSLLLQIDELPVGAMFAVQRQPFALTPRGVRPWSFAGYGKRVDMPADNAVEVLTPMSVLKAFAAGFEPAFHSSADTD